MQATQPNSPTVCTEKSFYALGFIGTQQEAHKTCQANKGQKLFLFILGKSFITAENGHVKYSKLEIYEFCALQLNTNIICPRILSNYFLLKVSGKAVKRPHVSHIWLIRNFSHKRDQVLKKHQTSC